MVNLTTKQKEILSYLAKNGPSWYYELSEKEKIASNKTVLQAFHALRRLGLMEVKKEEQPPHEGKTLFGRKRKYYGLTFKGLIHSLKIGAIEPREAREVRIKHGIALPAPPEFKRVVEYVEENWGFFYFLLKIFDFDEDIDIGVATWMAAQLTLIWLNERHPHLIKKYIKGTNLVLPNGVLLEDWKEIVESPYMKYMLNILKSKLPQVF
ncbi:hypothetical protein DRO54_03490 [Candidatus Bathyarchaeota archaeon]|nr:MAG: hypothetical protein DRO54_03490 [Candidatus Bathyarchaeota archaeon]